MRFLSILLMLAVACTFSVADDNRNDSIHVPLMDLDEDYFSNEYGFRGANWRGKDASDLDEDVYPGAGELERDGSVDYNCNGISGWSKSKGKSNENWLCERAQSRGVIIFGDSAAAAFHIPESFLPVSRNLEDFAKLLNYDHLRQLAQQRRTQRHDRGDEFDVLVHEFDWPHKSWATGFAEDINGESIYMKMRERNRCNHRDFQNLAVNGAKAKSLVEQVGNFSRDKSDKPSLAFVAYIGNDICKKKLEDMTTVDEYREQIITGLKLLDNKLAPGSKVVITGLVDGRILWDTMHNRMHPLGMTYSELYDLLWDIKGNPCRTWLTSDASMRDKASARAAELSKVAKEIANTQTFNNFEIAYVDLPMDKAIEEWKKQGKDVADLIEVVDGFHPSHTAHRLLSKYIWEELSANYPQFLGPVNPNNEMIKKNFGEQGGH